jgi:hypothetical protein
MALCCAGLCPYGLDGELGGRQFNFQDRPDPTLVDDVVAMAKNISHSNDIIPWDLNKIVPVRLRDMFHRFGDDEQMSLRRARIGSLAMKSANDLPAQYPSMAAIDRRM